MYTQFRTNVDCAKRFMSSISGLEISPLVGDLVRVYNDSDCEINMVVVGRTWKFTNGSDPILVCELHVPPPWKTVPEFEKILNSFGFR